MTITDKEIAEVAGRIAAGILTESIGPHCRRLEGENAKMKNLLVETTDTLEECYLLLEEANKRRRDGLANTEDVVVSDSRAAVAKARDHLSK